MTLCDCFRAGEQSPCQSSTALDTGTPVIRRRTVGPGASATGPVRVPTRVSLGARSSSSKVLGSPVNEHIEAERSEPEVSSLEAVDSIQIITTNSNSMASRAKKSISPVVMNSSVAQSPHVTKLVDFERNLCNRILQEVRPNMDGKEFLPADIIARLASETDVSSVLKDKAGDVPLSDLVDYVLHKPAIKVFLTLALCCLTDEMKAFYHSGLTDHHLPMEWYKNSEKLQEPEWAPTRSWHEKEKREFFTNHWIFMAPVFTKDKFIYTLHKSCPLPILHKETSRQGGFSGSVAEVEVHEAHQKVLETRDGKKIRIALKMIRPQMGSYFQQEEKTLEVIRKIDHPHLIMPIASYKIQSNENGCFLFPWAEGGNLRQFWAKETVRPLKDPGMMKWLLMQMCGLCDGLSILHGKEHRHGDIKPENILLFQKDGERGTLQIADVGLAKHHDMPTQQRMDLMQKTNTMTGTTRYVSPEFVHADYIPRALDTWALGCVFVEFMIWILYGQTTLREFTKQGFDHFWEKKGVEFLVHPIVLHWLNRLSQDVSGPPTALASVLELIISSMLVPDSKYRCESAPLHMKLEAIYKRAIDEPDYLRGDWIWAKISTKKNPADRPSGTTLEIPGAAGSTRSLPRQAPDEIPDTEDGLQIAIRVDAAENVDPVQHPTIPTTVRVAQDQLRRLNDIWLSQSDNEFAQSLVSRHDWTPDRPSTATSRLCEKCDGFDLTQPGFKTIDSLDSIIERSQACELCQLLAQAAKKLGMTRGRAFTCQRSGPVLQIATGVEDAETVLSIHADLDYPVPAQCAQAGSPILPEPGSPSQFALMKEWLRTCQETHKHGQAAQAHENSSQEHNQLELPTRLVDVGSSDGPRLQLINSETLQQEEYFALSHCWGRPPMFSALKGNVDSLQKSIDFNALPRNFQDAITVTRAFGLKYIWIDSLCIVQDDEQDWENEAARMEQVFSNATCVLAASSAGASSEGFLITNRQPRQVVTMRTPSAATLFVTEFIDNFRRDVEEAVLNQRGWVLQERALARRLIHFTTTQIYMECGRGVQCESLMKLNNEKAAFLGDSDFPNSIMPYYKGGRIVLFQDLFRIYSGLNFTRLSDRSIAISGLERRLMAAFRTSGGYGIFDVYLERSLLWMRSEGTYLTAIDYPAGRKVPSWSWMAYKGSISYLEAPFDKVNWTKEYISPFKSNDTESQVFWSASGCRPMPVLKSNAARKFTPNQNESKALSSIKFDFESPGYELEQLRCIVVGKDMTNQGVDEQLNYLLVITASTSETDVYVRVGVGALPRSMISWDCTEHVEVH